MKLSKWVIVTGLLSIYFAQPQVALAVTVGQIDTFEDGSTQNWTVGLLGAPHPAPPVNVPTGGPAGTEDNFLLLTALPASVPTEPGSRLAVVNITQWTGDFVAAGVNVIAMDARNLGSTDLHLRLLFTNPRPGIPPTDVAFSRNPIFLPAGSGWTKIVFPITPSDLTPGSGSAVAALRDTTEIRIFHNQAPAFPPPQVQTETRLGLDNIQALANLPATVSVSVPAFDLYGLLILTGLIGASGIGSLKLRWRR